MQADVAASLLLGVMRHADVGDGKILQTRPLQMANIWAKCLTSSDQLF
jgi:hypothetical protein